MSDSDLYDKYADKPPRYSSAGKAPALRDPADRDNPDRPVWIADLVPRHGGNGQPKIWLPEGDRMEYYRRPSSHGEPGETSERLKAWEVRKVVEGYEDTGIPGRELLAKRRRLLPPDEDKGGHDRVNQEAKRLVFKADLVGTHKHAVTEKHDLGLDWEPDEEDIPDLMEWVRLTRHLEIVDLPDGRPGIEAFVAMDAQRLDQFGQPMFDPQGHPVMIRAAGSFDRLWRYTPCSLCGHSNYIGDLKTSSAKGLLYAQRKTGIQTGIYCRSKLYVPWSDGRGATRYTLPDVCTHRAIIVSIPAGTGQGSVYWVNVARGAFRAVSLIPQILDHQKENDWMVEFTPVPSIHAEIAKATSRDEIVALYHQYPGEHWKADNGALTIYASARVEELQAQKEIVG